MKKALSLFIIALFTINMAVAQAPDKFELLKNQVANSLDNEANKNHNDSLNASNNDNDISPKFDNKFELLKKQSEKATIDRQSDKARAIRKQQIVIKRTDNQQTTAEFQKSLDELKKQTANALQNAGDNTLAGKHAMQNDVEGLPEQIRKFMRENYPNDAIGKWHNKTIKGEKCYIVEFATSHDTNHMVSGLVFNESFEYIGEITSGGIIRLKSPKPNQKH